MGLLASQQWRQGKPPLILDIKIGTGCETNGQAGLVLRQFEVQGSSSPVFTVRWPGVSIVSPGVWGTEGHWDRTSFCTDNQRYHVCTTSRGQSTGQERTGVIMSKNK